MVARMNDSEIKNDIAENVRILIVDDVPQVRQGLLTALTLAARKWQLLIKVVGDAQDGREAIAKAKILNPDVILMDVEMPVLDGYEATREIKASQPSIRVVILTIHDGPAEQQRARLAGADSFLAKGCAFDDLLAAIIKDIPIGHFQNQITGGKK